jgi:hypothetical protein
MNWMNLQALKRVGVSRFTLTENVARELLDRSYGHRLGRFRGQQFFCSEGCIFMTMGLCRCSWINYHSVLLNVSKIFIKTG